MRRIILPQEVARWEDDARGNVTLPHGEQNRRLLLLAAEVKYLQQKEKTNEP